MSKYSALLKELRELKDSPPADAQDRKALLQALREAEYAVELPMDIVARLSWAPIHSAVAKAAVDMKLFNTIAAQKSPISLDQLSEQIGAKPLLVRRLLRFLSLNGLVEEPNPMQYLPNERTKWMAQPGMQASLGHNFDFQAPVYLKLPAFLKAHNYNDIDDVTNCPFQLAYDTDLSAFGWAMQQPAIMEEFGQFMAFLRDISPSWLDVFPSTLLLEDKTSTSPIFIDIGGSMGHQCHELLRRYPEVQRPVVLQDQAPVIQAAFNTPGVENQVYDFFTPQPVKDASFYYLKSVLHDWPDKKVLEILKSQISAMGPKSRILIDEIVLPEKGGHWRTAELDIALMAMAGSFERTVEQWKTLFDQVGLKKVEEYLYDDQMLYRVQVLEKV